MEPTPDSCHRGDGVVRYPDDSSDALNAFLDGLPAGSVVDVAPGIYEGPLSITRPVTLRGAGELTRISGGGIGRPVSIAVSMSGRVILESLRLEQGEAEDGGGMLVAAGDVQLRNIHIHRCAAHGRGGALAVVGGSVAAARLFAVDVSAQRGGGVWLGEQGQLTLRDSQLSRCDANFGGAIAVEDAATLDVDGLTIRRARARSGSGGQALYARGSTTGRPILRLNRVRLEDGSLGLPIVVDPAFPAEVRLQACDMPRTVRSIAGLVDGGANHWR